MQKADGTCNTNFKKTKHREQVMEALEEFVGGNTQILVRWMRVRRSHHRVFVLNKDKLVVASTTGVVFFFLFVFFSRVWTTRNTCTAICAVQPQRLLLAGPGQDFVVVVYHLNGAHRFMDIIN